MKKGSEKNATLDKTNKNIKLVSDKVVEKRSKHYIAEKKNNNKRKEKKENIFKRIAKYFKGVFKEVKRIRWTDKRDLLRYSVCTLVFVLFFGLYFYAIDWIILLIRSLA